MKKSLAAFYVKVALAVGVPALCVAVAVAINNNDVTVENKEINILQETGGDSVDVQGAHNEFGDSVFGNKTEDFSNGNSGNGDIDEVSGEPVGEPENNTGSEDNTETPTTPQDNIETTPEIPTTPEVPEIPTTPESVSGSNDAKYTYDALGRVICVEYDTYKIEYEYDGNGNILSVRKIEK